MKTINIKILLVVAIFIVVDVISGWLKAIKNGNFKSMCMRDGLYHKIGEILCVLFGVLCEMAFPVVGIDISMPIAMPICIYIILMETSSIIENLGDVSPAIKAITSRVFADYKNEQEGDK